MRQIHVEEDEEGKEKEKKKNFREIDKYAMSKGKTTLKKYLLVTQKADSGAKEITNAAKKNKTKQKKNTKTFFHLLAQGDVFKLLVLLVCP